MTVEDKDTLVKLIQAHATPKNSYAPLQQQIDALTSQLNLLRDRGAAIEAGAPADPEQEDEYPEYKQPVYLHCTGWRSVSSRRCSSRLVEKRYKQQKSFL